MLRSDTRERRVITLPPDRPFTATFRAWFRTANFGDILRPQPRADRDAVDLHFLIGGDALVGCASSHGIEVAAMLNDECYDLIYAEDVAAVMVTDGWHCSLCIDGGETYASEAGLWVRHLLEPFGLWLEHTLRPACSVSFYRVGGVTWAKLEPPGADAVTFRPLK